MPSARMEKQRHLIARKLSGATHEPAAEQADYTPAEPLS